MMQEDSQASGLQVLRAPDAGRVRVAGSGSGPRTIAVTSGKGGVGKTQVSANLSVGLAMAGKRVLVLDADLGLASLDLAFGLNPEYNLLSVLTGERTLDQILIEGPKGVHLIPACPGRYDVANLDSGQRARLWSLVEEVAVDFDVLIIDTGAGIGSNAVGFASYADEVVLVTTPDPTSLRDAYAMAKVLHRRAGLDHIQLLANQVNGEYDGAQIHSRMNAIVRRFLTLELDYLGAIPRDRAVREGGALGEPFLLRTPRGNAAQAMSTVVRRILGRLEAEARLC